MYDVNDFSKVISGDVGLTLTAGPGRYTIPWGQTLIGDSSAFEHAVLAIGDNVLIEARPPKARIRSVFRDDAIVWFRLPMSDEQRDFCATQTWLDMQSYDVKYAWSAFLYMGALRFGLRTEALKKHVAESKAKICSQLVDDYITKSGFHLLDGVDPGNVSPGDLQYRLSYDRSVTAFRTDGRPVTERLVRGHE